MKLTIKSANNAKQVIELDKDLTLNVAKGEQFIFSKGFTNYVLSLKDNQQSIEIIFNVDGKNIKVYLEGIVPFIQENSIDPENSTIVVINKNINDKDIDSIVENSEFNGSEIIDRLESIISTPTELGNADKLTLITDFQSLIESLGAAAAGGEQAAGGNATSDGSTFNSIFLLLMINWVELENQIDG